MGFIFDFLGTLSGYLLWFFFDAVSNYALAIVLFALTINIFMIPIAIKRQKNMVMTAKLSAKQAQLRKKYEKNPKKYNEELALLYEKEGVSPMNGCFSTMVLPLLLWSGVFSAITKPLQNVLHISAGKVTQVIELLKNAGKVQPPYEQLQLVRNFANLKDYLNVFDAKEFASIEEYSNGFNFFGINLLSNPSHSDFLQFLWVIPVLCFISSVLTIYISQKITMSANQMQGAAKFMPYAAALITTYVAWTMPGAVGLYWFVNGVIGAIQTIILNKYYNASTINAKNEAARYELLKIKESKVNKIK